MDTHESLHADDTHTTDPLPRPPRRAARTMLLPAAVLGVVLVAASTGGAVAGSMITGKQVKDSSLSGRDVRNGSLAAVDLAPGVAGAGPAGPVGPAGPSGPTGAPGTTGYTVVTATGNAVSGGRSLDLACPAGTRVLGAGADFTESFAGTSTSISDDRTKITAYGTSSIAATLRAWATCATVG